jgi:hypothetical protein
MTGEAESKLPDREIYDAAAAEALKADLIDEDAETDADAHPRVTWPTFWEEVTLEGERDLPTTGRIEIRVQYVGSPYQYWSATKIDTDHEGFAAWCEKYPGLGARLINYDQSVVIVKRDGNPKEIH